MRGNVSRADWSREVTDEQYIDDLFAKEPCGYENTPGFRSFLLDAMATIGERPRAGDVASMHMAYKAGRESHIAIGDTVRVVSANDDLTKTAIRDHDNGWGLIVGDTVTVCSMLLESEGGVQIKVNPVRCMDRVTFWYVALCDLERVQS